MKATKKQTKNTLLQNIIDSSHFTGSQKLWFLQHLLIPCIQWPILIYEVPISLVSKLEQKTSVYIRKWLKLHKSITSLLFYSSASPCPLPVRSLTSVLKSSKISRHLLLKHSWDASVLVVFQSYGQVIGR